MFTASIIMSFPPLPSNNTQSVPSGGAYSLQIQATHQVCSYQVQSPLCIPKAPQGPLLITCSSKPEQDAADVYCTGWQWGVETAMNFIWLLVTFSLSSCKEMEGPQGGFWTYHENHQELMKGVDKICNKIALLPKSVFLLSFILIFRDLLCSKIPCIAFLHQEVSYTSPRCCE